MSEQVSPGADEYDTLFSLPAVDADPLTEIGVILMGLDADRLLAGLGLASLADDPASSTLLVDRLRHGNPAALTLENVVAEGIQRWRAARKELAEYGAGFGPSAAVRQSWEQAMRVVTAAGFGELGAASRAYLAACWLRRSDVDAAGAQDVPVSGGAPWHT